MTTAPQKKRREGEDRLLSLPNVITTPRLVLLPWYIWLLAQPHHRDWFNAALLIAALGITDWLDGQVARRFDQVTTLGKIIDPVADRFLLATAGISILIVHAVPLPIAIIALGREATVATMTIVLAAKGAKRVDVTMVGKAGAFGLMLAFPSFLAGHSNISWHHGALIFAWITSIGGVILGWISVGFYIPLGKKALADGRREKAEKEAAEATMNEPS